MLETDPAGVRAVQPAVSFGRHSNQILVELMNTPDRPKQVRDRLDSMFRLIDQGDVAGACELRSEIERDIGPDEPELVRADIMLRLRKAGG